MNQANVSQSIKQLTGGGDIRRSTAVQLDDHGARSLGFDMLAAGLVTEMEKKGRSKPESEQMTLPWVMCREKLLKRLCLPRPALKLCGLYRPYSWLLFSI